MGTFSFQQLNGDVISHQTHINQILGPYMCSVKGARAFRLFTYGLGTQGIVSHQTHSDNSVRSGDLVREHLELFRILTLNCKEI